MLRKVWTGGDVNDWGDDGRCGEWIWEEAVDGRDELGFWVSDIFLKWLIEEGKLIFSVILYYVFVECYYLI